MGGSVDQVMRVAVVVLFSLAVLSVLIAALIPVSRLKGRVRLFGSLSVATTFCVASLQEMHRQGDAGKMTLIFVDGIFLVGIGLRKYRRDPEGWTPPALVL